MGVGDWAGSGMLCISIDVALRDGVGWSFNSYLFMVRGVFAV